MSAFIEHFERLQAAKSMVEIMNIVRTFCNFFSYDIIEELVKALGDEEDKRNLSRYVEAFSQYAANRKVSECPTELSPTIHYTDSGQHMILGENYDDCTLSHLRLLQQKFCKILQISSYAFVKLSQAVLNSFSPYQMSF